MQLIDAAPLIVDNEGKPVVSMKVVANHMKINLAQFLQFFNEATGQMRIFWPVKKYIKVIGTDIGKTD